MQSFRTEIENPIVERDIIDLEKKIALYYEGKIDEERFRSLRLARGVYGQRQFGVQMIRIKLPYGRITSEQLHRISNVSDEYSRGRLHITTRQDIQIHHDCPLEEAVRLALTKVVGAYAIAIISVDNPNLLIAARKVVLWLLG